MKTISLRFSLPLLLLPLLAVQSPAALVQYGFDFTSGTVSTNGSTVTNDGTGTFNAGIVRGNGGTYSADIPSANLRQFTTGIGSLRTDTGAIRTGTGAFSGQGVASNSQISAAGGLTLEAWVKDGNNGIILTMAGAFALMGTDTGYRMVNGGNVTVEMVAGSATRSEWTHIAAVYANPVQAGSTLNTDMMFYVNGVLAGQRSTNIPFDLSRGLGVGDHPLFPGGADLFNGLVYEPRISLGALTPANFTYVPEPGGLALLSLSGLLLSGRRRRASR